MHITKLKTLSIFELLTLSLLIGVGLVLTLVFGLFWFDPLNLPHNFHTPFTILDVLIYVFLSYVVWHQIVNELFVWIVSLFMRNVVAMYPVSDHKVAFLTAFVPGKEPYDVLDKTLAAMVICDYPHETWLLDEGDDAIAKEICKKYGVHHYSRKGKDEYNTKDGKFRAKTKAGNYNSWCHQFATKYDFITQLDVYFVPHKDFLTKTLGYFNDPTVGFVGTPQIYGNQKESWIAKAAAEQAFSFYGVTQRGLFGLDMVLFIGANHVVRVAAHTNIGGYSGHIVEDHLTGMRFYSKRWKSVYIPEILAVGEGPATWSAYFSQQMRWAYGLIHILLTESPRIFPRMQIRHAINYFLLQQYYFDGIAQAIGIFLLVLYFFFGIQSTSMDLVPMLARFIPVLLWQQVIFLWLQRYYIDPKNERGLLLKGKLLSLAAWPVYFVAFISVFVGKRLGYEVTPKGNAQIQTVDLSLFAPHFVFATATLLCVIAGYIRGDTPGNLIFVALMNSVIMYGFFGIAVVDKLRQKKTVEKYDAVLSRLTVHMQS